MLFSAIRAKGGFNNNPTVSQFEAAYKSIIVHSEIKSSSSANCMALDDTTILTVSSSNIKVKDTQSELLDLLCVAGTDDLENDNLVSVYQHSNFINDVVACIAGFVVRKIKKKTILCDTCAVEIEVGSSESKLLDRKNRGGLIKPSHDVLQIFQTSNPEAYRTLVHYLRNEEAEFHTFQLKEDKPMRIVIRNLHLSTSTEMIKNELEHRLYEVRQVTQVISKIPLPLFFVDLEPTDHSKEIFKLESILHTKIKIEEPHKPKIISQCQNCQAYGHTKAYCGYSPRCVRCGDDHSSSACPNSRQDPMRCAFCTGALYSPPHHNISNATFTDYFNTIKNNFIIGGDYNAKHNAWGCRTNNPRGIVLYNFVNANNFNVLAPPGPTYWPSSPAKNPDILDIFETKIPSNLHCLTKNILELNSDHSSVILNVSATVFARVEPPRLFSPLTDRLEFQNIINQRIDLKIKLKSNYDIDEAVNNLTMLIQSATWEATKPNKTHDSKNNYPIVSDQIRCLIVEKRRARAKYQVTRLPSQKTAYNKLANLLKKVLAKYKSFIMNPPAKSSLSPSHIKNTKNNLTIHPIKIVKSNDNTNNWQTVPIRSPSTPTSPNPIIQKTNSFSSKNRFSALATNEISYEISNEVEMLSQEISNVQPKIPPIYIKDDIDFFDFCKKIKPFTDPDGFNTKSSSSGLKLMTYSINAYRQIIKFLEINNMNFHTYQTNEEKAFRVVIRHLHHTTPTDYIKEELHSLGFITRSITNCLQYKTKNPLPLFFVDLEPSPSNHNIYKVDSICYTKIKIEAPHPKKNPVQRLRCQNYGHTRTYCHHTPRCVKRCDIHLSFECQKDSNTPATCALCSGDHPASYKGCPKFKLLQKGRSSIKTNRPTET
ncbi:hypothetical protein QTP88_007997 [Uroleucon formosanum]